MNYGEILEKLNKIIADKTEMNTSTVEKIDITKKIAAVVNENFPQSTNEYDHHELDALNGEGISLLKNHCLSSEKTAAIRNYFKQRPVYNGHVPEQSDGDGRLLSQGGDQFTFGSYTLKDSLQCPHLLELALNPNILALAEAYLGCTPVIYSMNTWWSFPGHPVFGPQDYHRDVDDFKFLALFIYLTDVKGGDHGGEHSFVTYTHKEDQVADILQDKDAAKKLFTPYLERNGYGQQENIERLFAKQIKPITGPAGSVFIADTYALHRGVPPQQGNRLVCWIRYGLKKNLTYFTDRTQPVPLKVSHRIKLNRRFKYILHLIVKSRSENFIEQAKALVKKLSKNFNREAYVLEIKSREKRRILELEKILKERDEIEAELTETIAQLQRQLESKELNVNCEEVKSNI